MQNLSLQNTQNTPLSKMTDAANKTSSSADIATSTERNSPFQMMLNKQVQAQQAPAKQTEVKPAEKDHQDTVAPGVVETKGKPKVSNQAVSTANNKKINDKSVNAKVDSADNASATLNDQVTLDPKDLLKIKVDADAKASDAPVNKSDSNGSDLTATPLASAINVIPLVNTQAASLTANTATQSVLSSDATTQAQRNLDAVLGHALQQSKAANLADVGTQGVQAAADAKAPADQNNWLEAMLPSAARQAVGDESANAKLILNAMKDGAAKEVSGKDAAMPASYLPVAQMNAATATQQAGSTNSINVYPGKTGWDQAISQKVVWMVGAGEQSATLTLNPPDLGPLQVVIHVHNDQANTTFISDNADVRQALQDGMSNLRDKMSESGIQLGQANVSSGEQSQQQFQQATQQSVGSAQLNNNGNISVNDKAGTTNTIVRISNGLVDTFA